MRYTSGGRVIKSETLVLTDPDPVRREGDWLNNSTDLAYSIPYLPAYTIVNHHIDLSPPTNLDGNLKSQDYELRSDKLILKNQSISIIGDLPVVRLTIQHAGISDHTKLFPYIEDASRRARVGQYAFEAEKTFESGAWASFVIMVGAVIEGILGSFNTETTKLSKLLKAAAKNGLITQAELETLDKVREARNLIHAGEHKSKFIDRAQAMEVYGTYYNLIRKDWEKQVEGSEWAASAAESGIAGTNEPPSKKPSA